LHPAIAVARRTGIGDHLPASAAVRARLLHGEDAALHAHLPASVACAAGLDLAVGRTRAVAGRTRRQARHLDALLDAGHGLFQVELHHVADVRASARPAPGTAATENVAEDVPEDVAHVGEARPRAAATAHAVLESSVAVRVVHAALAGIRQHLVRLLALLERLHRGGVARVAVRVVLHRAAPVGFLQLVV